MEKTYKFHIKGMHCKSCELMTESELKEFPFISKVKASLNSNLVEVVGDFGDRLPEDIATELNTVLVKHGYTLAVDKHKKEVKWSEFKIAIPITIFFVVFYVFLQKIGLVNLIATDNISYGTAFIIGIIASLSSCMAVVGGLVLSMSATFAREGDPEGKSTSYGAGKIKPHAMFHISRLVSFFILGGVIGAIGSAFQLGSIGTFILGFIIAIVMLILGINLLDIFHWAKKLQPGMPKFISKHAMGVSKLNHTLTPALVGVATFFLPCGFTQSMQIFTLSTGNFSQGAFTMLSFALGTFPVLALLSFSSFSIQKSSKSGIFFKTAGLVVILFAIFNLINALVVINILPPIFNF
ncbi:MAG: sulfite exporter TauE/SafE family protein [Candidatus Paceibacterota bacterium]|jgi:sulfite exporter TauE/SafE/copper chaperone CopZ